MITQQPTDKVILQCPFGSQIVSQGHWTTNFYYVHKDLGGDPLHTFSFKDWKYNGGAYYASFFSDRTRTDGAVSFNAITNLLLTHTPQ